MAGEGVNWWKKTKGLAGKDTGQFLFEIYRNGALATLEVMVFHELERGQINRTWAMNPEMDGLRSMFNIYAADERYSLRRAAKKFTQQQRHAFLKADEEVGSGMSLDTDTITPAALLDTLNRSVEITKAIALRKTGRDAEFLLNNIQVCEDFVAPALEKLPQNKPMSAYPKL